MTKTRKVFEFPPLDVEEEFADAKEEEPKKHESNNHNPDLYYTLRDMAEFDAYGTIKPSQRPRSGSFAAERKPRK